MLFPKEFVECIFCCFARPHAESALASRPACRSRNSWQPAHSLHKLQEIPFITCDSRVRRNKFSLLSERASSIKRERKKEEAAAAARASRYRPHAFCVSAAYSLGDHLRECTSQSVSLLVPEHGEKCSARTLRPVSGDF